MCKDEHWQVVITTSIGDMAMRMKIPISKAVFSGLIMSIIDIGILITSNCVPHLIMYEVPHLLSSTT